MWTITDTVANVNTALANVAFIPATDYDLDTTISVNVADGGENGTVAVTGTINLDVTPVNDQLGATLVNQTQTYTEGDPSVALDDIVVTDVDTGEIVTATLTLADINAGSLTTSGTATYTGGTGVWTITDTVANVNTALANVAFIPATDYDLDTTISVNVADGGENGTVAVTGTINLDVTPVNDQLGATLVNQTQTYTEGDPSVALDDIVVTDVDTGEIVTATLTLADINAGALTTSGTATYTPATGVWTITDTVANVNTALANVAFIPATDYDLDTTISVNVADGGENGTVAVTGTINLDVTPVNDQLGATLVNQTQTYTEGDPSVALDDIFVTDVDTGEIVTATLTLADVSAGTLTTSGTATYIPATGVWSITDTVANVNTALATVAFMPATEYDLDTTIAVNIADGGENGTVAVTGTINLDVTPVLDLISLWVSTDNDVPSPSGVTGLDSWSAGEALEFGDPNLAFGENSTDGTFSSTFDLNPFALDSDADIDGLHYVNSDITVGNTVSGNFVDLKEGDLLLSVEEDETISGLAVADEDVFMFRPTVAGDYSAGTFTFLLDMDTIISGGAADVTGISLVEQDTAVGNATVFAGSFSIQRTGRSKSRYSCLHRR